MMNSKTTNRFRGGKNTACTYKRYTADGLRVERHRPEQRRDRSRCSAATLTAQYRNMGA